MIEIRVKGTLDEIEIVAEALTGVLVDVELAPNTFPQHGADPRVRGYIRAAAVRPEFLHAAELEPEPAPPAPVSSSALFEVPPLPGSPPPARQRWNAALKRHAWWRLCEHWRRCLHCGVYVHNQPGRNGRWYRRWGYPEWPDVKVGDERVRTFPACPGPGVHVSSLT